MKLCKVCLKSKSLESFPCRIDGMGFKTCFECSAMPLTSEQLEIVNGSLLGDAGLRRGVLRILHTRADRCYVEWSHAKLSNLCSQRGIYDSSYYDKRTCKTYHSSVFSSRTTREFKTLEKLWYPSGTKIVPNISLTPLTLAVWYSDDGWCVHRIRPDKKQNSLECGFCTDGFTYADVTRLCGMVNSLLETDAFRIVQKGTTDQYRIYSNTKGALALYPLLKERLASMMLPRKLAPYESYFASKA